LYSWLIRLHHVNSNSQSRCSIQSKHNEIKSKYDRILNLVWKNFLFKLDTNKFTWQQTINFKSIEQIKSHRKSIKSNKIYQWLSWANHVTESKFHSFLASENTVQDEHIMTESFWKIHKTYSKMKFKTLYLSEEFTKRKQYQNSYLYGEQKAWLWQFGVDNGCGQFNILDNDGASCLLLPIGCLEFISLTGQHCNLIFQRLDFRLKQRNVDVVSFQPQITLVTGWLCGLRKCRWGFDYIAEGFVRQFDTRVARIIP